MNIRSFSLIVGAVSALTIGLVACGSSSTGGTGGGIGGSTGNGTAGGAACTTSCADAITNGGEPCSTDGTGETDYAALVTCAGTSCATECSTFISGHTALDADSTCPACITSNCSSESSSCSNN